MSFRVISSALSYFFSASSGGGSLGSEANYRQMLDTWLLASGPKSDVVSGAKAVELCLRCVRDRDKSLILPPGKLISLPPLPEHIEQLYAPSNRITRLPEFNFWPPGLQEIHLPNNRLKKVNGRSLPPLLTTLDVSNNAIRKLNGPFPKNLHSIFGSNNFYENLPIDWPDNLQHLILKNCGLHYFPNGLPSTVHFIDVSGNPIWEIAPEDFPMNLQRLCLARTGITTIPDMLPPGLLDLDVSGNEFCYFDGDIYQPEGFPSNLRNVDFRGCNLRTPPQFITKLSNSATVDLRDNPLSKKGLRNAYEIEKLPTSQPRLKFTTVPRLLVKEVSSWLEEGAGHVPHQDQIRAWGIIQSEPGKKRQVQALSGFLGRLRQTDMYQDVQHSASFSERVYQIICDMQDNKLLRQRCMQIASEAIVADDDQLIAKLVDMESEKARWQNERGEKTQIVYLHTQEEYRDACLNPKPDTTYQYHDRALGNNELTFTTDSVGRAINSSGQLRITTQKQRFKSDSKIGYPHNSDALPGDNASHAGANQFGFPGGALNVFPGSAQLNSSVGDYGQYEDNTLRQLVLGGETVHAQFIRKFDDMNLTTRPDTLQIIYKVDGEPRVTRTFINFADTDSSD